MKIYREVGKLKLITQCDAEGYVRPVYEIEVDEAELVKHGSWVGIDDFPHEDWECTNCGYIIYGDDDIRDLHYCPNCGAKMDGGDL